MSGESRCEFRGCDHGKGRNSSYDYWRKQITEMEARWADFAPLFWSDYGGYFELLAAVTGRGMAGEFFAHGGKSGDDALRMVMADLTPRERTVLEQRYGIWGGTLTRACLPEVARRADMSVYAAEQTHASAIRKLKDSAKTWLEMLFEADTRND